MNLLFPIIILGAVVFAGIIIYRARKQYEGEVFTTSDEIVASVVAAGGRVEAIKKVGNSELNGGITFEIQYVDASGNLESRQVFQEIDENGFSVGPLSWNKPLQNEESGPPIDDNPNQSVESGRS